MNYRPFYDNYESEYESEYESDNESDNESDDEYDEYVTDAVEFIKGIEDVNRAEFPKVVNKKIGKRTLSKKEFLEELKLILYSMFETRLSILLTFSPKYLNDLGIDANSYNQIHNMVDNRLKKLNRYDASTYIVTLTDLERSVIGDPVLESFLESHPKVAYNIVKRFSK